MTTKATKSTTRRKKKFAGVVLREFKVDGTVFKVNDKYSTTDKTFYNLLLNTKRIK